MSIQTLLEAVLTVLGVGFLAATLRLFAQYARFRRLRASAILTWPGRTPPFYPFLLLLGAILAILVFVKIGIQGRPPWDAFGEAMMSLYYAYALPLSLRIGRGFYREGLWTENGFIPYMRITGLRWREGPQPTLVIVDRVRELARTLVVPDRYLGEARRLLRDRIAAHDIMYVEKSLDLGGHDEREDI